MDAQAWEETHFGRKPPWLNFKIWKLEQHVKFYKYRHDLGFIYAYWNADSTVVLDYSLERETLTLM